MELNLADVLEGIAFAAPEREALVVGDRRFTWGELWSRTARFGEWLTSLDLGLRSDPATTIGWRSPHDHVALMMRNGSPYLESMVGAFAARCAPVNVNYRYRDAELSHVLTDSASRVAVVDGEFAERVAAIRDELPHLEVLVQVDDGSGAELAPGALRYEDVLDSVDAPERPVGGRSGDDRYVCYTGGTTGLPKAVMWRQADFLVAALGVSPAPLADVVAAARRSSLRALPAPPFMHGAAHWNAFAAWVSGGAVVLPRSPGHLDPADVWSTVEREAVTSLLVVGDAFAVPLIDELVAAEARGRPYRLGSLRQLLSGGAVLSAHVRAEVLHRVPELVIVDVLGSSESGRQAVSRVRAGDDAAPAAGRFVPEPATTVLDAERTAVLSRDDRRIGWLAQSGRVPLGYLGDAERTAKTFPTVGGRRYAVPGDRARWRDDGSVELLGRDSVCINTGGEKVFAEEVESVVRSHPAVFDAVVCGRPSPRWGQEIVAIAALRPGEALSLDELVTHTRARLADFKAPKALVLVGRVLRSPSGKADYAWARSVASGDSSPVATDGPTG